MRYSSNLNIIIKAVEKATRHIARDFLELTNLQSNPASANKFTLSCYNKVKKILIEDLQQIRPDYNLIFADGHDSIKHPQAEYSFVIFPIDGIDNLSRANPDFTTAIALEHSKPNQTKETIALVINKIASNETYYCEKGFGAYLNNRRIRVGKRSASETPLIAYSNPKLLETQSITKFTQRTYGCNTIDISYFASAKIDIAILEKSPNFELLRPFLLLASEAGGRITENDKAVTINA